MSISSGRSALPGIVTAVLIIIVLVTVGIITVVMRNADPNHSSARNREGPTLHTGSLATTGEASTGDGPTGDAPTGPVPDPGTVADGMNTATSPDPDDPDRVAPSPTVIHYVSPLDRAGIIQPGWRRIDDLGVQDVECRTSDVSIHDDIYNCGAISPEAQVCFPSLRGGQSYCAVSPFTTRYVTATFTGPVQEVQHRTPRPWGVVLEDGRRCVVSQGSNWGVRADGHREAYSCNGIGPEVVLSHGETPEIFDVSHERWTVKVGELGSPGDSLPPPRTVKVTGVYYAAWANEGTDNWWRIPY